MDRLDDVLPDLQGFDDEAFRELLSRASLIAEMTQHRGWPIFCDYMIATTASLQRRLIEGYCQNQEEYRELVGQLKGIRSVLQAPDRLIETVQNMHQQAEAASQNGEVEVGS
jgi:hypothetical protein